MPDITDPIIIRFCNERARVAADALEQSYNTARRLLEEYEALDDESDALVRDDQVADGSESSRGDHADGRHPVTGTDLNRLLGMAELLVTWFEETPLGLPSSRIEAVRVISVNGGPRF